jgi:hypothetical protein
LQLFLQFAFPLEKQRDLGTNGGDPGLIRQFNPFAFTFAVSFGVFDQVLDAVISQLSSYLKHLSLHMIPPISCSSRLLRPIASYFPPTKRSLLGANS